MNRFKRLASALTASAMLLTMAPAAFAADASRFTDVPDNAWYAEAVQYVTDNGLMSGTGRRQFAPNASTTRGMLMTVLARNAGTDTSNSSPWYQAGMDWAKENGVSDGTDPTGNITRAQLVTMMWRYAGSPTADADEDFADERTIPSYAATAVDWAHANGVVNGTSGNRFDPQTGTRAQVATILRNYLTRVQATETIVQTTAGKVQGSDEDGIYRYLGVPYAEAKERFVPASDVTPWDGVRMATSYGPMSPQGTISGIGGSGEQAGTDNNDQNLNIWTPGINDGEKRPVMVWLHGGGFSTGSANEAGYDGENLSREGDVVVVGVNHRLNAFGFLDLSAYGDKYKYSANVGIMDIIDALKWIQNNIEAFGGDPNNVTVFGQSGGGAKVLALMTSPYAKGLFNKGIVQSGATETMGVVFNSQQASTRLTENILAKLGISASNIEDIQNVSVNDLQTAASAALQQTGEELQLPAALGGGYSMDWEPVVDGDFLPTDPVTEDGFAAAGKDISLLIGSNLNEWNGFFPVDPITPTDALTSALRSAYPNKPDLTAEQVDTTTIRLPLLKIMSHKADQNGAPVYAYVFTYGNSYHGAEIPYMFDNLGADATDAEKALASQMSQAWINFAKTGTPSADGLPTWEPYTRANGATILLDTQSTLAHHHDQALMNILYPDYVY